MSKIFISHAEKDKEIVQNFVELLYAMGISQHDMFCSSIPELGVPTDEDIFDYLKNMFDDEELYVLFMLSENYYNSVACLNEMGAAWGKQTKYTTFLLPGVDFSEIKGTINPRKISIKLDDDVYNVKSRLNDFKDKLSTMFDVGIDQNRWERKRDDFLQSIQYDVNINMQESNTYCIGDTLTNGCVFLSQQERELSVAVDFSKTSSNLCSVVIFPQNANWARWAEDNKSLSFDISATNKLSEIDLEIKTEARILKYRLNVTEAKKTCAIPLKEISANLNSWKKVKEICFLISDDKKKIKSTLNIARLKVE